MTAGAFAPSRREIAEKPISSDVGESNESATEIPSVGVGRERTRNSEVSPPQDPASTKDHPVESIWIPPV